MLKPNNQNKPPLSLCSLPTCMSLPVGCVAFHTVVMDRQDAFPEPIIEEIP